jgi:predicted house-cleaning noncanonical NTP pyrophosphatase (MazG superfamily)
MRLVRDNVPAITGQHYDTVNGRGVEVIRTTLREKLHEEVCEYLESGEFEGVLDIVEVCMAMAWYVHGVPSRKVTELRMEKHSRKGGFKYLRVVECG